MCWHAEGAALARQNEPNLYEIGAVPWSWTLLFRRHSGRIHLVQHCFGGWHLHLSAGVQLELLHHIGFARRRTYHSSLSISVAHNGCLLPCRAIHRVLVTGVRVVPDPVPERGLISSAYAGTRAPGSTLTGACLLTMCPPKDKEMGSWLDEFFTGCSR